MYMHTYIVCTYVCAYSLMHMHIRTYVSASELLVFQLPSLGHTSHHTYVPAYIHLCSLNHRIPLTVCMCTFHCDTLPNTPFIDLVSFLIAQVSQTSTVICGGLRTYMLLS